MPTFAINFLFFDELGRGPDLLHCFLTGDQGLRQGKHELAGVTLVCPGNRLAYAKANVNSAANSRCRAFEWDAGQVRRLFVG